MNRKEMEQLEPGTVVWTFEGEYPRYFLVLGMMTPDLIVDEKDRDVWTLPFSVDHPIREVCGGLLQTELVKWSDHRAPAKELKRSYLVTVDLDVHPLRRRKSSGSWLVAWNRGHGLEVWNEQYARRRAAFHLWMAITRDAGSALVQAAVFSKPVGMSHRISLYFDDVEGFGIEDMVAPSPGGVFRIVAVNEHEQTVTIIDTGTDEQTTHPLDHVVLDPHGAVARRMISKTTERRVSTWMGRASEALKAVSSDGERMPIITSEHVWIDPVLLARLLLREAGTEEAVSELIDFGMIVADERNSIKTHIEAGRP